MRLIDADRLNEVIERNFCYPGCLKQIVDAQPTAYDVDKVVEQIRKEVGDCEYECAKCKQITDCDTCRAEKAAEIVKAEMKG